MNVIHKVTKLQSWGHHGKSEILIPKIKADLCTPGEVFPSQNNGMVKEKGMVKNTKWKRWL